MSLPQELRLKSKLDFDRAFKLGRKIRFSNSFALVLKKKEGLESRFGVVVGKKVSKKAVERNYLRRIMKNCLLDIYPQLESLDIVWIISPKFAKLKRDLWYKTIQEQAHKLVDT